ncbi:hypothetical protein [Varunaivibrio sulfuroxidans]|uniref:Uncharacterized protein n=1 Tax=Varunaivibrio sulfuroxidans TaxID=1773489 RepID=A0A4R3J5P2_9PROT|nr:hypothetical protein [Varunaivibrio sulfuroxidans]TCS60645.1 hypothetical protein EDD55_110121 [Varunaivibrio sulfuroxidans]WES30134.1 hypothetical protein P3M64_10860 [Varunaivibrio sulfuroxidans]
MIDSRSPSERARPEGGCRRPPRDLYDKARDETRDSARVARALGYPYAIPDVSYRLTRAGWRPLAVLPNRDAHPELSPVIAAGSNASPQQLERKFDAEALGDGIIVTRAALDDYDTVHCAHFSRYGAIPANLYPAPGVRAEIYVTWLTADQLARMHLSEALGVNYTYRILDDAVLHDAAGRRITAPGAYICRHGALSLDGEPVPLAAFRARGRRWPARDQKSVLARMRDMFAPGAALEHFILRIIDDDALRARCTAAMKETAHPFSPPAIRG